MAVREAYNYTRSPLGFGKSELPDSGEQRRSNNFCRYRSEVRRRVCIRDTMPPGKSRNNACQGAIVAAP
jgi:hypothetical protein